MAKTPPSHEDLIRAGWVTNTQSEEQVTITRVLAGQVSSFHGTKAQHDYAAEVVRQRQAAGYFTPCEAAQEMEDLSLVPDAVAFLRDRLLPSIRGGSLQAFNETDRLTLVGRDVNPMGDFVTRSGVNAWLESMGVPIRWSGTDGVAVCERGNVAGPHHECPGEVLPPKGRGGDLLQPLIKRAYKEVIVEGGDGSATSVFLRLVEWARRKPPVTPLHGVTQDGIQWIDDNEVVRETSKKLIRERLGRVIK